MVGIVVTISPSLSLYRIVVLPAASRPTIKMRICFLAKSRLIRLLTVNPIFTANLLTIEAPVKRVQNYAKKRGQKINVPFGPFPPDFLSFRRLSVV